MEKEQKALEDKLFDEVQNQLSAAEPMAQQLQSYLNNLIAEYQLKPATVLNLLARLSAGYIHTLQRHLPTPNTKDYVEHIFLDQMETYLASYDQQDIQAEVEKIEKVKYN